MSQNVYVCVMTPKDIVALQRQEDSDVRMHILYSLTTVVLGWESDATPRVAHIPALRQLTYDDGELLMDIRRSVATYYGNSPKEAVDSAYPCTIGRVAPVDCPRAQRTPRRDP